MLTTLFEEAETLSSSPIVPKDLGAQATPNTLHKGAQKNVRKRKIRKARKLHCQPPKKRIFQSMYHPLMNSSKTNETWIDIQQVKEQTSGDELLKPNAPSNNPPQSSRVVQNLQLNPTAHTKILNVGKYLGYEFNLGLCRGFTLRWIEACLLKEENKFSKRIQQIILSADAPENLLSRINNVKEKIKNNKNYLPELTEDETEALEILAFYESLFLYHRPTLLTEIFNQRVEQDDVEKISQIAACTKIKEQGGLRSAYSEPFIYTRDEISTYLNEIRNKIKQDTSTQNDNIGFLLSSKTHAIGLVYQPKNDSWRFMDVNQWPSKVFKADKCDAMVGNIIKALSNPKDLYTAFNTRTITIANTDPNRVARLAVLKQEITKEVAQREAKNGVTLTYLAAQYGHHHKIPELAKHGADLNKPTTDTGSTPTWIASQNGYTKVIDVLAEHGADLNKPTTDTGSTPTWIASQNGYTKVIDVLAKHGADLNIPTKNNATPMYIASQNGHADVVATLAKHKADPEIPYITGATPTYIAAKRGHIKVVSELAKYKADLNKSNNDGITPIQITSQLGHANITPFLKKQNLAKSLPDVAKSISNPSAVIKKRAQIQTKN